MNIHIRDAASPAAMVAALGGEAETLRLYRRWAEAEIERLLSVLDALDGDSDLEPDDAPEEDDPAEPWLGAPEFSLGQPVQIAGRVTVYSTSQIGWARGADDDREYDPAEQGEPAVL